MYIYMGEITYRLPGHIYIYILNKNPGFMALRAKTMYYFCGSSVFLKLDYHLSLWIPDRPYSLSGAKSMAHKPKLDINSNPTKGNLGHFG